jgi:hypothetical protein
MRFPEPATFTLANIQKALISTVRLKASMVQSTGQSSAEVAFAASSSITCRRCQPAEPRCPGVRDAVLCEWRSCRKIGHLIDDCLERARYQQANRHHRPGSKAKPTAGLFQEFVGMTLRPS